MADDTKPSVGSTSPTVTPPAPTTQIKPAAPVVVNKPSAVTAPIVVPKASPVKTEAQELHDKIQKCVQEHDGIESNIPHNHVYWQWLNRFRSLVNKY